MVQLQSVPSLNTVVPELVVLSLLFVVRAYLPPIMMRGSAFTIVVDEEYRQFSKFNVNISNRTIVVVILRLAKLFERRMKSKMSDSVVAVMYDDWTASSTHSVSAFATYCVELKIGINSIIIIYATYRITLLTKSPVTRVPFSDTYTVEISK